MPRIGLAAAKVREGVGAIARQPLRCPALEMEALAGIGELDARLATRRIEIGRVDAKHSAVDLRFDRVTYPSADATEANTSAGTQYPQ